ncbi:MAG: McrB family protein, partial [Actinomycetota bacterium]
SEDTFCRWMEFKSKHLGGIGGGSAMKHIIFKRKSGPGWYYPTIYRNEQDAWTAVRAGFVDALNKAQAGEWAAIDDIQALKPGSALLLKTLFIYFPEAVVPIYSRAHIRRFLGLLACPEQPDEAVQLNRTLLSALRQIPAFDNWRSVEIMEFLYDAAREGVRVVKIAPGENAQYWAECLQSGYICVGWDDVGDLREFESKDAFRTRFEEQYRDTYKDNKSQIARKAKEVWTLRELEAGDKIIANRGTSTVLAVGTVVEPGYEWNPTRTEFKHTVPVTWDTNYAKDIPAQKKWAFATVAEVPPDLYRTIIGGPPPVTRAPMDPRFSEVAAALERKGQVILYGPPGTGKTYVARRFCVWWLLRGERPADAAATLSDPEALARLETDLSTSTPTKPARLNILTFHPSYSYEDFIEGFRPAPTTDNTLSLTLQDGVFKRTCRAAAADPDGKYLFLIDEINRANIAKVFGELLTLLELDKRGVPVTLPQSKQVFTIPANVYIVGTMNTADRSIKLLDTALRRRFAFVELMPDPDLLAGAKVGNLALDEFLEELNRRIVKTQGREKQVGHSFLLDGNQPITDPDDFARRFRQEILPLLQEYCYDDYGMLASYLGDGLIDTETQTLNEDVLGDPARLVARLEDEFAPKPAG